MVSFFMSCPQCGASIPKDGPCTACNWSDRGEDAAVIDQATVEAYALRFRTHATNYAVYMVLMFGTGLLGVLTAYMWWRVIYTGSVGAFLMIGLLTVATGMSSVVLFFAKKLFPVDLNCPACNIRLDEVGTNGNHCPNCSAQLKQ